MSQVALKTFLLNLDKELKKSSEEYREVTANRKDHSFLITVKALKLSLKLALEEASNIGLTDTEINKILRDSTSGLKDFISEVGSNFRAKKAGKRVPGLNIKVKETPESLTVDLTVPEKNESDIFNNVIRANYLEPLNDFYTKFLELVSFYTGVEQLEYTSSEGKTRIGASADIFNLEHDGVKGSSNVEKFIEESAYNAFQKLSKADQALIQKNSSLLTNTGSFLGIDRLVDVTGKKPQKVFVFLGSAILNRLESESEGRIIPNLTSQLQKVLISADIPNLEGSDSVSRVERQIALKKIQKPYKKIKSKNVKKTFESDKIKAKSKNSQEISTGGKTTKGRAKAKTGVSKKRVPVSPQKRRNPKLSVVSILAALNSRLPQTVAANMRSPALNYRTGRFASSVRATDIISTRKGFPSIGYTYDKNPYQTFEVGFAQGDPDRDPRKLITESIREIMTEYAIGRFFTRRV